MPRPRQLLHVILLLLLSSCTTTPQLHLIKSAGVSMELTRPASYVFSTIFSPDGKYALSGSLDNSVAVWDLETGRQARYLKMLSGDAPGISALFLSGDGKYLLTGTNGGGWITVWDAATGKELRKLSGHSVTESIEALALSPDGSSVLSGGSYEIRLSDMKTGRPLSIITHASFFDRNQPYAMAFSPDRKFAFTKGPGFISLWDVPAERRLWLYGASTGGYRGGKMVFNSSAQFSPDGRYILSGEEGNLQLRDRSGALVRTMSIGAGDVVDAVAFSRDGKFALAGSTDRLIRLWDIQKGVTVKTFAGHSDEVASVAFSPDGRRVISGGDASTRLWDRATGEELATLIQFGQSEWLVLTPEGYYNASENGAEYLNVIAGEQRYGIDRFYDVFYRPDIVAAKLKGEDIRDLVTITMKDALASPPPTVEVTLSEQERGQSKARICYAARNAGGGIGEVRLFQNGKLVQSDGYYRETARTSSREPQTVAMNSKAIYDAMRTVTIRSKGGVAGAVSSPKGDHFEQCREIDSVPGENEVSVSAFNSSNTVQSPLKTVRFTSSRKPEAGRLYVLAIGIDRYRDASVSLRYAAKDARDMEDMLRRATETLYDTKNIHTALLLDNGATRKAILDKIDELAGKVAPTDSFILFVAGHGVLYQNQYYLLTHDYDGTLRDSSMISSNEIVEMSKKIRSLGQLFIFDTCHAGGVDAIVTGLYDARMSVLARKMGLHIYASASDKQAALDGYRGNGLFTYTLLDGLNNNRQADRNGDGLVTVVGLGEFSRQETARLSQGLGHQQTPIIINVGRDNAIYKLR